jgi:hypothetical protein
MDHAGMEVVMWAHDVVQSAISILIVACAIGAVCFAGLLFVAAFDERNW